jgi:hypothetical protein
VSDATLTVLKHGEMNIPMLPPGTYRVLPLDPTSCAERREVVQEAIAERGRQLEPVATSRALTEAALDALGLSS